MDVIQNNDDHNFSDKNNRKEFDQVSTKSRGHFGSKWEFLLSCVGLSVGLGNVWRFPYLCYQNGGGAFLIPYLIMLFLAGKPLYFMELSVGQFVGSSPLGIWNCVPLFKGVGASMAMISLVVCIYYNVVMSYTLYYIGNSFQSVLPWQTCDGEWAKDTNCTVRSNGTVPDGFKPASQVFWERKVLELTPGIEDLGGIKWDLALCLGISWIIVILCLLKGVKTSGKVVYFAATFPYFILITLLIVGLLQEGAWEGVKLFFVPEWGKLIDIQVWQAAAGQMFYSLSIGMGALIMFSSYNDFRHDVFKDALIVSILDTLTSIIAGVAIFSILGMMANELNVPVESVVQGGPGLAFVAYPEALTKLPVPQLWSVLFFSMLFMLGLDSEFALVENILTCLKDEIPFIRKHPIKFCAGFGVLCFLLGLPCVTRGGQYIFNIMDTYGGSIPLVFIAITECIGLMWFYGYKKFAKDLDFMLHRKLGIYWVLTWKFTAPIILSFIFVYSLIEFEFIKYGEYEYPFWADIIGICIALLIILQTPLWAIFAVFRQKDSSILKKIKSSTHETESWGPINDDIKEEWRLKNRTKRSFTQSIESTEELRKYDLQHIESDGIENISYKHK